ncbi:hypothetical protein [Nocardia exalbida]|uniref:hypothetical protein n=1 Tax=Nocardia exalbida TaxID=290231 RepID=UPI0002F44581|nr:hypothetical protein [Nocardia exalbida]
MDIRHIDSATAAFKSFAEPRSKISTADHRAVQTAAIDYWFCVDDHELWGPSMLPPPQLRSLLTVEGIARADYFTLNAGSAEGQRIEVARTGTEPDAKAWLTRVALQAGLSRLAENSLMELEALENDSPRLVFLQALSHVSRFDGPYRRMPELVDTPDPSLRFLAGMLRLRYTAQAGDFARVADRPRIFRCGDGISRQSGSRWETAIT